MKKKTVLKRLETYQLSRRRFMGLTAGGLFGGTLIAACGGSTEEAPPSAPSPTSRQAPPPQRPLAAPAAVSNPAPANPAPASVQTGEVVVGDVIDHVLASDDWGGDFGYVTFRLHEGSVDDQPVYFIRTDASDADFASQEGLVYVPLMANAAAANAGLSGLWLFENGTDDQTPVLSSAPHMADYSPAFRVCRVTFTGTPERLGSADAIRAAERDGRVNVEFTDIIVNYPVVKWPGGEMPHDTDLMEYLGGGQLTEPVDVAAMTVTFKLHACYPSARYIVTDATMMGSAMMNIADAPGAAPLTAAGATAKILVFGNGVEGSGPMGAQKSVVDTNVGDPDWSPFWDHYTFVWEDEAAAEVLRTYGAIEEREAAGDLQRFAGVPDMDELFMVNCPVPVIAPVD